LRRWGEGVQTHRWEGEQVGPSDWPVHVSAVFFLERGWGAGGEAFRLGGGGVVKQERARVDFEIGWRSDHGVAKLERGLIDPVEG